LWLVPSAACLANRGAVLRRLDERVNRYLWDSVDPT
jgi:hypothetical protein